MAAGLRIDAGHVDAFAAAMGAHAREHIGAEMLTPILPIDAEVSLAELSVPMVQQIEAMAPFGAGNPPVALAVRDATVHAAPGRIGKAGGHAQSAACRPAGPACTASGSAWATWSTILRAYER